MEYQDVYDVKWKPRILEYLMNDHIPNETDPSPQHCDLQRAVNYIKNLGLLSESFPQETKHSKTTEDWAMAVDSWHERVLSLVSSSRVSVAVFKVLISYGHCLNVLHSFFYESLFDSVTVAELLDRHMFTRGNLSRMQLRLATSMPPSDSISIKVATFASLSDLLKRLSKYSEIKKDVMAHTGKLVQPVLDLLLDKEFSEVVVHHFFLITKRLTRFYGCLIVMYIIEGLRSQLSHALQAEAIIVSKIISGQCSSSMMKSYANLLASLPKSRGDKDSWFVMMQDLLTSLEIHLNDVFRCLEQAPEGAPYLEARKSKQLLTCIIPTLMLCCITMLTNSYPVQVTVPVDQLLTLVRRVLTVNGSFSRASSNSMEIMQEGYVCIELPALQSYGLDLLYAIIKGTSSQLLPHAGCIIRLLKDCLKQCALPTLRTKLYFIIRNLLISMGIGAALQISEELTISASIDLDASRYLNRQKASNQVVKPTTVEAPIQPADKKRKHAAFDSFQESRDMDYSELQNKSSTSPLSLKIAALKALQTLLTMGGILRSDLRPRIDDLLMNVAENAYNGKWRNGEESEVMSSNGPPHADFLLAVLHALLASLLSQPSVIQHHLVKGLELFRKGKQEAGTKVADFCGLALLALEKLINPSKVSNGCSNEGIEPEIAENLYLAPDKNQIPNSLPADQGESLFSYLFNSCNESEATLSNLETNIEISEDQQREAFLVDIEIERDSNEIMNKKQFQGEFSVAEVKPFMDIKKGPEIEFSKVGLDAIDCDFLDIAAAPVVEKAERSFALSFEESPGTIDHGK
ncbi:hypothetical protein V6N13_123626 [Hibiscus sabdariffa]|uniref:Pre-rRNA-processing protein RIX1 N-terminal domain-containing protein n=1 Tax=Hibiscus sabdariffa TaxID=183260 RepID=A0ABR2QU22_9ROSI